LLDYVPGLELIFKTATEVLSNIGATAAKKLILQNAQSQLASTGRVVQEFGLYDVMDPMMYGVYKKAYVPGGKLAKEAAVRLGWELAQKLAADRVSARLKTFEAPLLAATYGAIQPTTGAVATTLRSAILAAVQSLARTYAQLNPLVENGYPGGDVQENGARQIGFLDRLWNQINFEEGRLSAANPVATDTISYLKAKLTGQDTVITTLQFIDRMMQAAVRVEGLHQNVNGYANNPVGSSPYPTYIKYGGFLRELTELGFEIARANPTTTAGVNPASEWIENLLEENGSGAGIRLAADGLSQLFNGFTLDQSWYRYTNSSGSIQEARAGMDQVGQGLEEFVN
jgi:hypothetical protein